MNIKRRQLSVFVTFLLLAGLYTNLNAVDKNYFDTPKSYVGVATPIAEKIGIFGNFDNEYKGVVLYTPIVGTFFKGPVLDTKGNVIKHGDILVKMDTEFRNAQVMEAKANINKDLAALKSAKMLYERYKKHNLSLEGAISKQDLIDAESSYLQALAQLEADRAAFILASKLREACTYYARFDGVVDEVNVPSGYCGDYGIPTLRVSQLVPIGINVKMSREEATALSTDTTVLVYPLVGSEPVEPFRGHGRLTKDGVQLILRNCLLPPKEKVIDGKKVKVITGLSTVAPFRLHRMYKPGEELSVNEQCLMKDKKGTYVLKDSDQEPDTMGQGINPIIKIKKVYVTPGNRVNPIESNVDYIVLKDNTDLKFNDKLLYSKDADGIKDGDTVYYQKNRYMFMPGDPVKVVVGGKPIPRPGT